MRGAIKGLIDENQRLRELLAGVGGFIVSLEGCRLSLTPRADEERSLRREMASVVCCLPLGSTFQVR